jgi:lipoprotein-releasing system permease protein
VIHDRFSWSVALRDLRSTPGQTILSMGVVSISVTLIIFLVALIGGLQRRLIGSVTGSIAHVSVRPPERVPVTPASAGALDEGTLQVGERVRLEQQKRKIEDWVVQTQRLARFDPAIAAVSPVVEGQGIISRGTKRRTVAVTGVLPEVHNKVVDIEGKLVGGRFYGLLAGEAAIGYKLADDLAVRLGDKLRLTTTDGAAVVCTVGGIFDTGFSVVDAGTVFLPLRDAQSLFSLGSAVTAIGLKLTDTFSADGLAARLARQTPYEVSSWMRDNQTLLSGLKAQSQSSALIIAFAVVAAGFGVASILVMTVSTRRREIGILKAIGATRRQILGVFTLEGILISLGGALGGAVEGVGLVLLLARLRTTASATGRQIEVFPMDLSAGLVLMAMGIAVAVGAAAALYPAWRAARIDPIEVMRAGG